jgi:hypothetical protein
MNNRLANAIKINFKNVLFCTSMELLIIFVTLCSAIFSFWPVIYTFVTDKEFMTFDIVSNILAVGAISYMVGMFTVFLVTRVGVQVGFSKGSMVTETILTSISRTQLYLSYVVSSALVAIVSLFIIFIPFIVAGVVKNNKYVLFCGTLHGETVFLLSVHILLTVIILISMVISLASIVRRAEDTGPLVLLCLIPTLLSMIYVSVKADMYQGWFYIFNLIPMTSWVPSIAIGVRGKLDIHMGIIYISSDLFFLASSLLFGKKIFKKNITVK